METFRSGSLKLMMIIDTNNHLFLLEQMFLYCWFRIAGSECPHGLLKKSN